MARPAVIDKVTMLTATRHPASVTLDEPSTWCMLPLPAVRAAIGGSSAAQGHALASVADSARQARESFVDVAVRSTTERLATWLLVSAEAGVAIRIPRPQDRLALQLGMTRVSLNRALHRLVGEQVIELCGSSVSIRDAARLRVIANR